jgi:hypothetical protein
MSLFCRSTINIFAVINGEENHRIILVKIKQTTIVPSDAKRENAIFNGKLLEVEPWITSIGKENFFLLGKGGAYPSRHQRQLFNKVIRLNDPHGVWWRDWDTLRWRVCKRTLSS